MKVRFRSIVIWQWTYAIEILLFEKMEEFFIGYKLLFSKSGRQKLFYFDHFFSNLFTFYGKFPTF